MSIKFSCPLCHTNLTAKDKQSGRSLTCPACGKQIIIPADYYKILRVATNASDTEIDAAYRKLAMRYNPGHNPDDSKAIEKFKLCETAYEILSDPAKRAKYDRTVARDVVDNDKDVSNAKTSPTQSPFKNTFETVVKGTVAEMKDFVEQKVTEYKEEVPTDVGSDSEIIKSNTKRNQWFILGCIVVVIILASATSPGNAFGVIIIGVILGLGFLSYNIVYKNIIETIYLPAYKIINSIVDNPAATRKILIIATICVLPLLATGIVSVAPFITIIRYAKRWKQWQPTLNNAMNVISQSTAQLSSSASVSSTFDKVKNVIVQSTAQLSSSPSVSSTFDKVKNVIAQSTAQLSSSESVPSTKPMMSDNQRVDHAVTRSGIIIQIVKTRLQSQRCRNFDCDVITNDAYASKNEWLSPGWVITCDETKIYLSLRGQIAKTTPAWKIADWIGDEDINLVTKVSKNDDIIAYPIGTDEELINEILEECNSVPF